MGFWDYEDGKTEVQEKVYCVSKQMIEDQRKIWFLNSISQWVTLDPRKYLNIWNEVDEEVDFSIKHRSFAKGILHLVELEYLDLVLVLCKDNLLSVWDLKDRKEVFVIKTNHQYLSHAAFFNTF